MEFLTVPLETKYRLLQSGYGRNRNFAYYKLLTPKKNDYIYDNCTVEDADKLIVEKLQEYKSKTDGAYFCSRY